MKNLLFISLMFLSLTATSQIDISGSLGYAFFGSGDLRGHSVAFGVNKPFKKRFAVQAIIRNDAGSSELPLTFTDPTGQFWNSSFRNVTTGTQLELTGSYAPFLTRSYHLEIGGGVLGRYQISNYYSDVLFLYPGLTGYPVPLISLYARDNGKYKRFSVGYLLKISNIFQLSSKSKLGFALQFQNDNKGDLIWNIPVTYSYRILGK